MLYYITYIEIEVFKWMLESRLLIGQSVVLSNYWLRLKLIVPSNQFLYGNPVQFLIFGDISAHDPVNTVILGVFIIFHAFTIQFFEIFEKNLYANKSG